MKNKTTETLVPSVASGRELVAVGQDRRNLSQCAPLYHSVFDPAVVLRIQWMNKDIVFI